MAAETREKPRAIVLRTAGTNCDYETLYCLNLAGFEAEAVHVNRLINKDKRLDDYSLLVIPGGFADGDYLGSGKILANKLTYRLGREVPDFISSGGSVLGICNGFQVLVKAGLLPALGGKYGEQQVTLTFNTSGRFQDEWIEMENVNKKACGMVHGIKTIECPINHGEGRFVPASGEVLKELYRKDLVVFKYKGKNPNGSVDGIAGICDESGRVLGMMPHPEKSHSMLNHPHSTRVQMPMEGGGMRLFRGAFGFLKGEK
ncbi:MAG: phosphoribosylformylglycinamidine synthase I [Candidatus Diapherotrites archaeon]